MLTEQYDSTDDVDIDELVDSIRADLNRRAALDEYRNYGNMCGLICKIVHRVRQTDRNAYDPSVLSIGPYHHLEPPLLAMETEKWICLDYILKLNRDVNLREYLSLLSGLEKQVRGCYSEDIEMESKEFLQMLLLDSCFILVYLGGMHGLCKAKDMLEEASTYGHETQEDSDPVEWYNSSAVYDLLLLENQIPFFIVKAIYQLFSRDTVATIPLLTSDISEFMEGILYHFPKVITEANRPGDFYHLLHLCQMYLKPGHKQEDERHLAQKSPCFDYISDFGRKVFCFGREQNMFHQLNELYSPRQANRWRRAVEYHEAGIEFKKRVFDEEGPHSLLDIRFRKGVMEMPCLPIDDKSSLLFRNLVAFEQTCPEVGEDITAYIVLMSEIISTAADVALLAQKGIIVHQMESDEEVSTLFTKLFDHVAFDFSSDHYLKYLWCAMETHYQSRLNRWNAWLWHNHFSNPWLGFAAITSAFIVLCSIMQTALAFLSYIG